MSDTPNNAESRHWKAAKAKWGDRTVEQATFRRDHKLRCAQVAMADFRIHDANIYFAQAAYFQRLIDGKPFDTLTRNDL